MFAFGHPARDRLAGRALIYPVRDGRDAVRDDRACSTRAVAHAARATQAAWRGTHGRRRREAVRDRRRDLRIHRNRRRRSGRAGWRGERDRASWAVWISRRDQPALRPDRVRDDGRDEADALHRRRPRAASAAAVRRCLAVRPVADRVHRATRAAPAAVGHRHRDHRPAQLARHAAARRIRAPAARPALVGQPRRACRRSGAVGDARSERSPRRANSRQPRAVQPEQRRALARARRRARAVRA